MSQRTRAGGNLNGYPPINALDAFDELDDEYEEIPGPSNRSHARQRRPSSRLLSAQASQLAANPPATRRSSKARSSQISSQARTSQGNARATQGPSMSQANTLVDLFEFTQPSQQGTTSKISEEEEYNLIATVIRYLLVADRPKTLIQRANIIKAALPNHSKYYKQIMAKVQPILRELFGYNLVELEGSKYILTNELENYGPHLHFSKSEKSEQVLLFIALAHIFMSDESGCEQEELFDLFRTLDIIEDIDFRNDYFGDVRYLLSDKFIKQGYLQLVKIDKMDPPTQHYQWGIRAENEITPRHILEFMSKIFGGRPLNTWPVQFKLMQTRENLSRTH